MSLREGWEEVTLNDIGKWGSGGTPKRTEPIYYGGNIPWLIIGDINDGYVSEAQTYITEEGLRNSSAKLIPKNTLLIAMYGSIGKLGITQMECATNQAIAYCFIKNDKVNQKFVFYYLLSMRQTLLNEGKGGAQQNISQTMLKAFPFPLPSLSEQKQIAQKLDKLLARVERIKTALDNVSLIIKRFRKSVLSSAIGGRLSEGFRGTSNYKNNYPIDWNFSTFSNLGELARGKSKHRPRNDSRLFGGKYPFIQTGVIANSGGKIIEHSKTYSEFGLEQSRLFPRDTLCITIAANIADTAFLTYPACFPDSVVGFIADNNKCEKEFIKYFIDINKETLESFAPATAQKNINLGILRKLEIPLPPLEEQKQIVKKVETFFAIAEKMEANIAEAQKRVDRLTQSILAKAFLGELK